MLVEETVEGDRTGRGLNQPWAEPRRWISGSGRMVSPKQDVQPTSVVGIGIVDITQK